MLSPENAAEIERIVRKVLVETKPTPSPQATPPTPYGYGSPVQQLKDILELQKMLGVNQQQVSLTAEIEKLQTLKKTIRELVLEEGGVEGSNNDPTDAAAMNIFNKILEAKLTPKQVVLPQQPNMQTRMEYTDQKNIQENGGDELEEETLTDEAIKGLVAQVPASWAKKILNGEIKKPEIDGFMQLRGMMPLTDQEFQKALIFLKDLYPSSDQKSTPKPKSPKKPEASKVPDSTDSQEQK